CDGTGYKTPDVTPGVLPARASAISNSLNGQSPEKLIGASGTPIEGALRGATQYCLTYQANHANEQCVAVIVTDGKPEHDSCEKNFDKLAAIAKAAKDKGVITFAVGLKGADFTLLDKIAKSGGAPDCDTGSSRYACDVSGGADKLSDALAKIRQTTVTYEKHTVTRPVTRTVTRPVTRTLTRPVTRTVTRPVTNTVTNQVTRTITHIEYRTEVQTTPVPCEWTLPQSTEGAFDRDKLNVRWSVESEQTTLLRVGSKADCQADAWFYDDPLFPTRVIACDQTCEEIKASEKSSIDLLLGCATIVPG
ncbi:MAG TPA: VWA domain-containing protein, partial [Polyangiales bacterium]|nr:VWA domain-containing protein [Polyangiales bacterium]